MQITNWAELVFTAMIQVAVIFWIAALMVHVLRPEKRRRLLRGIFLFAAVGLIASTSSGRLLGMFGLAWRRIPTLVIGLVTWGSVVSCVLLGMESVIMWRKGEHHNPLGMIGKVITVVLMLGICFYASFWTLWGLSFETQLERVMEYQGEMLVEEQNFWHHYTYDYYAYRGPLVRGSERLHSTFEVPLEMS